MKYTDTSVSHAFIAEVAQNDEAISLGRAGLFFAKSYYPDLDEAWYAEQLDLVANAILARLDQDRPDETRLGVTVEKLDSVVHRSYLSLSINVFV